MFDYLGNQPKQKTYVSMRPDTHNAYRRRLHAHRTVATMGCILSMWICAHCLSRSQVQSLCSPKLLLVSKYLWDTSWIWQFWLSWPHWWNPPPVSQTKPNPKHSSVLLYLPSSIFYSSFRKKRLQPRLCWHLAPGPPGSAPSNKMVLSPVARSPTTIPQSPK